jgi:hypothetical protein
MAKPIMVSRERIEREIQSEHIDAGISQNTEVPAICVLLKQSTQFSRAGCARGDARSLESSIAQAHVRIEAAAGGGDRIGRNRIARFQTILRVRFGAFLMASCSFWEVGPRLLPLEFAAS